MSVFHPCSLRGRLALAIVTACVVVTALRAEDKPAKPYLASCPVKGMPVDESFFSTYHGKKVYFCCPLCPMEFDMAPEEFATEAHIQLFGTKQVVQVACPLTGKPFDPRQTLEISEVKVAFSSKDALEKAKELDFDARRDAIFKDLSGGFTLQTMCPVTGKPIDPAHSTEYKKRTVYFATAEAAKTFAASPEKYSDKLPQMK